MKSQANNIRGAITFGGTLANFRDVLMRNTNSSAALPTNLASLTSLRNFTVNFDNAAITFPAFTLRGTLNATTSGTVTQTGAISGSTLIAKTLNNSGAAITLTNSANDFAIVNLSTRNAADSANAAGIISYRNAAGFDVSGINTAASVNLTAGGAITDSGAVTGTTLTTQSTGGTILDFGSTVGSFNATNSSSGNIQLINTANTLIINSITQNNSGNVIITNTGALTTSGLISTNGGNINLTTLSPDAAARVLTINGNIQTNGGTISANSANPNNSTALIVNGLLSTTPGTGGTLIIGGGVSLVTAPTVGLGDITLQGNGLDITLGSLNFTSTINFAADRYLIINGTLSTSAGKNIILTGDNSHTGTGGVQITSTGSVLSGGNLTIQGSSLSGLAGANAAAGIEIQSGATVMAAGDISLLSSSNIALNGSVESTGAGTTINVTPSGSGVIQLGANVTADSGTVNLNSPVVMSADASVAGKNIFFANGVSGGFNLTLTGEPGDDSFTLAGPLSVNSVAITGSATGNNFLTVDTNSAENWNIIGSNQGNMAGNVTFAQIQNLTASNAGNTFIFSDGASMSGVLDGNNLANTNTLDYSNYSSPINVILSTLFYSGDTKNNAGSDITHFNNINNLIGSGNSVLQLPNKTSTLTINSSIAGFVNDPLNYTQFTSYVTTNSNTNIVFNAPVVYNAATGQFTINGAPIQLSGFNPKNFSGDINIANAGNVTVNSVAELRAAIPGVVTVQTDYYTEDKTNVFSSNIPITNHVPSGTDISAITIEGQHNLLNSIMTYNNQTYLFTQEMLAAISPSLATIGSIPLSVPLFYGVVVAKDLLGGQITSPNLISAYHGMDYLFNLMNAYTLASFAANKSNFGYLPVSLLILLAFSLTLMMWRKIKGTTAITTTVPVPTLEDLKAMSFEIRTHINTVAGFAQLIYNGDVGHVLAKQKEFLGYILAEAYTMISDLAKIEAGEVGSFAAISFRLRTCLNNIIGFTSLIYHGEVEKINDKQKECLEAILLGSNNIVLFEHHIAEGHYQPQLIRIAKI